MTTATTTGKVYTTYVDQWLDKIPAAESEDFREFAEMTPSVIEIWVYAGVIGYPGTFNDLARWVKMKYKSLIAVESLIVKSVPCTPIFKNSEWLLPQGKSKEVMVLQDWRPWRKSYVHTLKHPRGLTEVLINGDSYSQVLIELCGSLLGYSKTTLSLLKPLIML